MWAMVRELVIKLLLIHRWPYQAANIYDSLLLDILGAIRSVLDSVHDLQSTKILQ